MMMMMRAWPARKAATKIKNIINNARRARVLTHVEARLRADLLFQQEVRNAQLGCAIDALLILKALFEAAVAVDRLLHAETQGVVFFFIPDTRQLLVRLAAVRHKPRHDLCVALE